MAQSVVGSLFGPSPEDLQAQRAQQQAVLSANAQQISPYYGAGYNIGMALGKGVQSLFGLQDPALKKATLIQQTLQNVNKNLTAEERANPSLMYQRLSEELGQIPELQNEAVMAQEKAQELGIEYEAKQATIAKTRQEALLKQQDYLREENGRKALQKLQEVKAAEGLTPTTEEVIAVLGPYMSAEKLAGMMQTSADKEAYRKTMLDQAKIAADARVQAAQDRNATAKEMEQIRQENRKELAILAASLKPEGGSKSSVYERGYANNFVTSAKELEPATTNLNILTRGGTSPVTAGVFTNLKNTGILSATGAALGTAMTPAEAGQYESIMLPVIGNIATMQNAGRRYTTAQTDRLEKALIAKPNQPYIVQVQKMGELRQIAEAAGEAAQTNPAMSDDQKASVMASLERVRQAIPFTGADVAKFSVYKKNNPTVKFGDWLKVNGSDKEAFGTAALPEKVVGGVTYVNDGKGWKKK